MKIKSIQPLLLLLFIFCTSFAGGQGLGFHSSYEASIDQRTSYVVFANQAPTIKGELTISFDLSILNPEEFGYICTIDFDNEKNIYSLSYLYQNQTTFLKLNQEGETNLLTIPIKLSDWGKGKWNSIELNFKLNSNDISVLVNNKTFNCKGNELGKSILANVFFGKHSNMIDVPGFSIRNLNLKDAKSNYYFGFCEDEGNNVYNQNGESIGYVENPDWLINDSYHWKPRYSQKCKDISVVQFDSLNNRFIIAEKDSVTFVNMLDDTATKKAYLNNHPVPMILGMSCMNNNNLLIYELRSKIYDCATIASLNLNNLKWDINSYTKLENERHHHNSYFDPLQQQLYIFGGYGDKKYYKSFHRYDLFSDAWDTLNLSGDGITPRFFSGMGELDDRLIIFGGAGNSTGDQSIGKKYYYDCYSIDVANGHVKKLWNLDREDTKLVSSRNLIFTPDSNSFYTICYPEYISNTYLKLYKYSISNGDYEILGDSIPMISQEIKTNANIYANLNTNELYCVIQQFMKGDSCEIKVYSINCPPLSINSINKGKLPIKNFKALFVWLIVVAISTILVILFIFIRRRKRLKDNQIEDKMLWGWKEQLPGPTKNAIYLFGEFAIYNRLGKEIAYQFSPQMKELFLFILYTNAKDESGVSSEQIYSTIWPDKPLKSAKNLKGVTINKIRNVLTDVEGIELIYENKHFCLKTEEPLYYDYQNFTTLHINTLLDINDENIKNFGQIIARGQFLKSIELEFLDHFKADVSNQILTIAPRILKHYYSRKQFTTCIYFAKFLYYTDELNDCAFYFIIQSNLALKKVSDAKKHYVKYSLRYQKIQGEDYDLAFSDLVKASKKYINEIS